MTDEHRSIYHKWPQPGTLEEKQCRDYIFDITRHRTRGYSQHGEEGAIQRLLNILGIETGWCCEFGAADGEWLSNTLSLLEQGWRGVMIEPQSSCYEGLEEVRKRLNGRLIVFHDEVKDLDSILARTQIPKDFGVLSIDCDGPDYFIWKSLKNYRPKVVIIEVSGPDGYHIAGENGYETTSLEPMVELGESKGYTPIALIGNVFFVANECLGVKVDKKFLIEKFCCVDSNGNQFLTPFVVSKEKKIIYFHIAKTGGSTIAHVLRDAGLDDGVLSSKKAPPDLITKTNYFQGLAEDWDSYFKFTFVRNKYDLMVSHWHYDKNHFQRTGRDFRSFITDYVLPSDDKYGYWIDQYYITQQGPDGGDIFDAIGRFENFDEDFRRICKDIGIEFDGRRDNVGTYDHKVHYSTHYDKEIEEMVYRKYRQEIDHFGFEVERK